MSHLEKVTAIVHACWLGMHEATPCNRVHQLYSWKLCFFHLVPGWQSQVMMQASQGPRLTYNTWEVDSTSSQSQAHSHTSRLAMPDRIGVASAPIRLFGVKHGSEFGAMSKRKRLPSKQLGFLLPRQNFVLGHQHMLGDVYQKLLLQKLYMHTRSDLTTHTR